MCFSGGNLFDRMSKRLHDEGNVEKAVTGGEDRISALLDELLHYVMSFLLSREAVLMCILARRWRMLWKSVPALRIRDPESYDAATCSSTFVDELLRLRDPTPLNVCDISSDCLEDPDYDSDWADKAFQLMEPWLRYALFCQVQVLRICFPWRVINTTLISSHLKRLHLGRMYFEGCSLDFLSCQVLEVLEMRGCDINANILSQSLQHLKIHGGSFDVDARVRISAPNLIGFKLAPLWGLAPLLDGMPSLVTAAVKLQEGCEEVCYCGNVSCEGCDAQAGKTDYPMALGSLSVATNLKLKMSGPGRDKHLKETDESCNSREQSLLSQHLKIVKIICWMVEDVTVHRILKILYTHGVPYEKIDIV